MHTQLKFATPKLSTDLTNSSSQVFFAYVKLKHVIHEREALVTQAQNFRTASEFKATNDIVKCVYWNNCGSERIHLLQCDSSAFMKTITC